MKVKKLVSLFLALGMVTVSLAACGGSSGTGTTTAASGGASQQAKTTADGGYRRKNRDRPAEKKPLRPFRFT